MFIDEAIIRVKAGDGGNGCLAFRLKNSSRAVVLLVAMAARAAT
jgi:hypothetical protein